MQGFVADMHGQEVPTIRAMRGAFQNEQRCSDGEDTGASAGGGYNVATASATANCSAAGSREFFKAGKEKIESTAPLVSLLFGHQNMPKRRCLFSGRQRVVICRWFSRRGNCELELGRATARPLLLMNLDETRVPLFHGDKPGTVRNRVGKNKQVRATRETDATNYPS